MKNGMIIFFLMYSVTGFAQNIVGLWKTIDDESGKPRSIVQIEKKGDKYYGKIIKLFREANEDQDPICEECPGDKKNKKVIGMEIIADKVYDEDDKVYNDGEILDPESGNIYECKIWIGQDGNLNVRGYILFLFRTQTWLPFNE